MRAFVSRREFATEILVRLALITIRTTGGASLINVTMGTDIGELNFCAILACCRPQDFSYLWPTLLRWD